MGPLVEAVDITLPIGEYKKAVLAEVRRIGETSGMSTLATEAMLDIAAGAFSAGALAMAQHVTGAAVAGGRLCRDDEQAGTH